MLRRRLLPGNQQPANGTNHSREPVVRAIRLSDAAFADRLRSKYDRASAASGELRPLIHRQFSGGGQISPSTHLYWQLNVKLIRQVAEILFPSGFASRPLRQQPVLTLSSGVARESGIGTTVAAGLVQPARTVPQNASFAARTLPIMPADLRRWAALILAAGPSVLRDGPSVALDPAGRDRRHEAPAAERLRDSFQQSLVLQRFLQILLNDGVRRPNFHNYALNGVLTTSTRTLSGNIGSVRSVPRVGSKPFAAPRRSLAGSVLYHRFRETERTSASADRIRYLRSIQRMAASDRQANPPLRLREESDMPLRSLLNNHRDIVRQAGTQAILQNNTAWFTSLRPSAPVLQIWQEWTNLTELFKENSTSDIRTNSERIASMPGIQASGRTTPPNHIRNPAIFSDFLYGNSQQRADWRTTFGMRAFPMEIPKDTAVPLRQSGGFFYGIRVPAGFEQLTGSRYRPNPGSSIEPIQSSRLTAGTGSVNRFLYGLFERQDSEAIGTGLPMPIDRRAPMGMRNLFLHMITRHSVSRHHAWPTSNSIPEIRRWRGDAEARQAMPVMRDELRWNNRLLQLMAVDTPRTGRAGQGGGKARESHAYMQLDMPALPENRRTQLIAVETGRNPIRPRRMDSVNETNRWMTDSAARNFQLPWMLQKNDVRSLGRIMPDASSLVSQQWMPSPVTSAVTAEMSADRTWTSGRGGFSSPRTGFRFRESPIGNPGRLALHLLIQRYLNVESSDASTVPPARPLQQPQPAATTGAALGTAVNLPGEGRSNPLQLRIKDWTTVPFAGARPAWTGLRLALAMRSDRSSLENSVLNRLHADPIGRAAAQEQALPRRHDLIDSSSLPMQDHAAWPIQSRRHPVLQRLRFATGRAAAESDKLAFRQAVRIIEAMHRPLKLREAGTSPLRQSLTIAPTESSRLPELIRSAKAALPGIFALRGLLPELAEFIRDDAMHPPWNRVSLNAAARSMRDPSVREALRPIVRDMLPVLEALRPPIRNDLLAREALRPPIRNDLLARHALRPTPTSPLGATAPAEQLMQFRVPQWSAQIPNRQPDLSRTATVSRFRAEWMPNEPVMRFQANPASVGQPQPHSAMRSMPTQAWHTIRSVLTRQIPETTRLLHSPGIRESSRAAAAGLSRPQTERDTLIPGGYMQSPLLHQALRHGQQNTQGSQSRDMPRNGPFPQGSALPPLRRPRDLPLTNRLRPPEPDRTGIVERIFERIATSERMSLLDPASLQVPLRATDAGRIDTAPARPSGETARMDVAARKAAGPPPRDPAEWLGLQRSMRLIEQELQQTREQLAKPAVDIKQLSDQMYREFSRRIRMEQQRRGM